MVYRVETVDASAGPGTRYAMNPGDFFLGTLNGTAATGQDYIRVNLVAGHTYTFAMVSRGLYGAGVNDPVLTLFGPGGGLLVTGDDTGPGNYASITFTASVSGTYMLDAYGYYTNDIGGYQISFTEGSRANFDYMMGASALYREETSWSGAARTPTVITWAFRTSGNAQDSLGGSEAFLQLSAAQRGAVGQILAQYSDVAGLTFRGVNPGGTSNSATILFGAYNDPSDPAGAYAYYPGSRAAASETGDVWLNNSSVSPGSVPFGSYAYFAIMHEMGHALGLAHPGDYNAGSGSPTYANSAQFVQDSQQYTIMSYWSETETGANFGGEYPETLMLYDIYALHQMYGADYTTRRTNSIYGFGTNLGPGSVYNFASNNDPAMCLWDGGGIDAINCSGFSSGQTINLNPGTFSSVGGLISNLSIAFGAVIENAIGGSGSDVLIGNRFANSLDGRGGSDVMRGQGGNDTYIVDSAGDKVDESVAGSGGVDSVRAFVSVNLNSSLYLGIIERVQLLGAGSFDLYGDQFRNTVIGNAGANEIGGGNGVDVLIGGAGADDFLFNSSAGATNSDRIMDFQPGLDDIFLENAVFSRLAAGNLSAANLRFGARALDADDFVIYNRATGQLLYDANGAGGPVAHVFAQVNPGTVLSIFDFFVV